MVRTRFQSPTAKEPQFSCFIFYRRPIRAFWRPKSPKRASWEKVWWLAFLKTSNLSFLAAKKSKLDVLRKGLVARFLAGPGNDSLTHWCYTIFHIIYGHFQASIKIKTSKHKRPVDPFVHGEICVHGENTAKAGCHWEAPGARRRERCSWDHGQFWSDLACEKKTGETARTS